MIQGCFLKANRFTRLPFRIIGIVLKTHRRYYFGARQLIFIYLENCIISEFVGKIPILLLLFQSQRCHLPSHLKASHFPKKYLINQTLRNREERRNQLIALKIFSKADLLEARIMLTADYFFFMLLSRLTTF